MSPQQLKMSQEIADELEERFPEERDKECCSLMGAVVVKDILQSDWHVDWRFQCRRYPAI
jgi:hypothetical protein